MVLWLCNGSARQFLIQLSTAWPHLERRRNLEKTWHKINKLRGKKRLIARLIAINLYFMPLKCKVHAEVSTHTVYSRCNELNLINVGLPPAATSHFTVLHKSTFRLTSTFNVNWYVDHFNCWESFRKKLVSQVKQKGELFFVLFVCFWRCILTWCKKFPTQDALMSMFPELSTKFHSFISFSCHGDGWWMHFCWAQHLAGVWKQMFVVIVKYTQDYTDKICTSVHFYTNVCLSLH